MKKDQIIFNLIEQEDKRQRNGIELIASENFVSDEVMQAMGDAGVPCGACQDTGEVLADPHLKAREMIIDLQYGRRGTYQTVGCPIKLSRSPAEITRPPELGEHTDDVLRDVLQVSDDEIIRLRQINVI